MKKLKIFLTFDHELPLGKLSTTYEKAIFEPTYKIFELAEKLRVPVTLFADVLCAIRYKEWDNVKFYEPYINQLKSALKRGHDVQLHLHPHWLTSNFNNGVVIASKDFKLADFKAKEYPNNIHGIIETGCSFLNDVCKEAVQDYKCVAYRGGGYSLAPESDQIFSGLYKNGIRFDSSICKGFYFKSAISEVDYRKVPDVPNWLIGLDGDYNNISSTGVFEIPIAGKPKQLLEVPTRLKMKKYHQRAPEDYGQQIHAGRQPRSIFSKIKQALAARQLSFDNYTYSVSYLMEILNYHVRKNSSSETILVSAIGHPKSMGDYSLQLMKNFVEETRKKYGEKVEFYSFRRLYDEGKFN